MNLLLMVMSVLFGAAMLMLGRRAESPFRFPLLAGSVFGFWLIAWSFDDASDAPIWMYLYVPGAVFGFAFVYMLVIHLMWNGTRDSGIVLKSLVRLAVGSVIAVTVLVLFVAPVAWAVFDRCLGFEYQGECKYINI